MYRGPITAGVTNFKIVESLPSYVIENFALSAVCTSNPTVIIFARHIKGEGIFLYSSNGSTSDQSFYITGCLNLR